MFTHRQKWIKTISERQKSVRNKCQHLWDTCWVNLRNVTIGQLGSHRKQRLYLEIEPDMVINYYSKHDDTTPKINK